MLPNTTQVPNIILRILMKDLSDTELRVLLYIVTCTLGWIEDPLTRKRKEKDWISYSQLKRVTGRQNEAITKALKGLESKGLIEILDKDSNRLRTLEERRGKKLFYRLKTVIENELGHEFVEAKRKSTSPEIETLDYNLTGNRSSIIGDTKETHTKTLTKVRDDATPKGSSCPLNNPKNPLRGKWPRGHIECVEYVNGYKFVNKGKQFKFLHQMLRAGMDFPDIDKITARVKAKPFFKDNGWDFSTLASEADRGSNAIT